MRELLKLVLARNSVMILEFKAIKALKPYSQVFLAII